MKVFLPLCLLLTLSACNQSGMYKSVQMGQQNACQSLTGSDYDECMAAHSKDYDQYQREREQAMQ